MEHSNQKKPLKLGIILGQVEKNFVNGRLKGVTVYYGTAACRKKVEVG
jgi:hypothetical protein